MKCLLEEGEELSVIDYHFAVPVRTHGCIVVHTTILLLLLLLLLLPSQDSSTDQLQRPKHFPDPVTVYTLRELTITWHLYGGSDFSSSSSSSSFPSSVAEKHPVAVKMGAAAGVKHSVLSGRGGGREGRRRDVEEGRQGGPGRDRDVLMEIELNKVE